MLCQQVRFSQLISRCCFIRILYYSKVNFKLYAVNKNYTNSTFRFPCQSVKQIAPGQAASLSVSPSVGNSAGQ